MINKVHFGKRMASLRRGINLSQVDLAEKLGVTSQAVSKWECGTALPDIELLLDLSNLYNVSINELLEGRNVIAKLASRPFEMDEIAYFLPKVERNYNVAWAKEIVSGKWISRNWNSQKVNDNEISNGIGKRISDHKGLILEIGAGPGGGFMPYILKNNPDATIIISDLSPTVVCEWKRFLDNELDSPNIYYTAFDFCDIPFSDDCIDAISDGGGIGNAEGDKGKALKEAYRVLKPGGLLVTSTGFVTKETLAALPESSQKVLKGKRPDIFEDLYEKTVLAGFKKIDSIICGCWYTNDDESTIADLARELGINLKFTSYVRYCEK
jgi:transcriptional regulator with XRE-family HTH domain